MLNFLELEDGVFQATSLSRRGAYVVVNQGDHWSIDSPTCEVELEQIDEAATRRNWAEVYSLERRWQEA